MNTKNIVKFISLALVVVLLIFGIKAIFKDNKHEGIARYNIGLCLKNDLDTEYSFKDIKINKIKLVERTKVTTGVTRFIYDAEVTYKLANNQTGNTNIIVALGETGILMEKECSLIDRAYYSNDSERAEILSALEIK